MSADLIDRSRLPGESGAKLPALTELLALAENCLKRGAPNNPGLATASRSFRMLNSAVSRPMRVAVLGESNSGKSTLANFLAEEMALPALPVANTRVPTLLRYASTPYVEAVYETGARSTLSRRDTVSPSAIFRLEVGLPSERLQLFEVLDFPGSANPLFRTDILAVLNHRIDAAIWATVATQAWRETERLAWSGLPQRIRHRGVLAITHCDLISDAHDASRLEARMLAVSAANFHSLHFVGLGSFGEKMSAGPATHAALSDAVIQIALNFQRERTERAAAIAKRLAGKLLLRLG